MADGTYITRVQAKSHLRVDFSDDDTYIDDLIALVEELILTEIQGEILSGDGNAYVQTYGTTQVCGTNTIFTNYTVGDLIRIKGETTRTIAVIDNDNELHTVIALANTADDLPFRILTGIPTIDGVMPKGLKHAMLLMIGHFYMIREPVIIGVSVNKIPYAFEFLIAPYKNWTVT